jgi:REP element-mobilizing transposase RayT
MNLRPHRQRKSIRLPAEAYLVPGSAWLVTIGSHGRKPVFADERLSSDVAATIRARCTARGAVLDVYCLMPDHAHLLLQVTATGLVDIVGDLKSCATRTWWLHGGVGPLWQRSFHDRGIRTPNDYERAVAYVLDNPVRAGLVEDWLDYPFHGGTLLELPS